MYKIQFNVQAQTLARYFDFPLKSINFFRFLVKVYAKIFEKIGVRGQVQEVCLSLQLKLNQ